ncbi:MAG TPA: hypothetical protein VH619_11950 [Verrucomicrobiae bacterium]|nr:hypothetical protein [Verrucomicrobiae bacterium]
MKNNPDKFYMWGTTTNFQYAFTYDPHAADGWLFEWGNAPRARVISER